MQQRHASSFLVPGKHGDLQVHVSGPPHAPLVLCVPGLSANSRSFGFIEASLAATDRRVATVDLRGRGLSPPTAAGTYGWVRHAEDLLAIADRLEAGRFELIGHSMGAFIGMTLANLAPERLRRLVLIDAVGIPEPASLLPILSAVSRLGKSAPTVEEYLRRVRSVGTLEPWSKTWDEHYRYELTEVADGVMPRTDQGAVMEDITYGSQQNPRALWPGLSMPTLLLRAARPLGAGFIVSREDRDVFVERLNTARAVDIDANHYTVMTHADTVLSLRRFLDGN